MLKTVYTKIVEILVFLDICLFFVLPLVLLLVGLAAVEEIFSSEKDIHPIKPIPLKEPWEFT
jgi:hypothetical protein